MKHELHNHPVTEQHEGIPNNKNLIVQTFEYLFKHIKSYWDVNHVVVDRTEYNNIKKRSKHKYVST